MIRKFYRILLCDDDPDEALFLETAFVKAGYQVDLEWFGRCSKLLNHLPARSETPDLIFVDINMPGENGLECLVMIKELPAYKNVPVIIYTTSLLYKDIETAFKNGASLYLAKSSSEAALLEMVKYTLTRNREDLQYPKKDNFCFFASKTAL